MEEGTRTDAERPVRKVLQPSEEPALGPTCCHWNREKWIRIRFNHLQLPFYCSKNGCLSAIVYLRGRFGKTWCFVGYERWRRRSRGEYLVFWTIQRTMSLTDMEKQEESRFEEINHDSHLGQSYQMPLSPPRTHWYAMIWNQRQALGWRFRFGSHQHMEARRGWVHLEKERQRWRDGEWGGGGGTGPWFYKRC